MLYFRLSTYLYYFSISPINKKCSQYFIPIHGKILLRIKTLDYKKNILLNHKIRTSVLVPPKYWCEIKFLSKNSIIMVACDMYYDPKDYLSNFKKYKEHLNNL